MISLQELRKFLNHPAVRGIQGSVAVFGILEIVKNDPVFYDDSIPFHEKVGYLGGELLNSNLLPKELFGVEITFISPVVVGVSGLYLAYEGLVDFRDEFLEIGWSEAAVNQVERFSEALNELLLDPFKENVIDKTNTYFLDLFDKYFGIGKDKTYTVYWDPLTLDLNNDGKLNVVGTDGGVHFDFNNDGLAGNTGWVGKDDGLLIFDANEDNNVTNGSELFGEGFIIGQKVREDGTIENIYAKNGFEALASLDTNKDGIVDANDKDFDKIKVWQDKNGNGKVDAGEMLTLKELGIVGLNTGYQNKNEISFTREDGSTGLMGDINFILYFSQTETVKSIL